MNYAEINNLIINGTNLHGKEIVEYCKNFGREDISQLGVFVNEWLNESPEVELRTSGSTGEPKIIRVEKNQMLASAALTADFFEFEKGQSALLCLPVQYIAGKMMVIRAMLSELNLICLPPSANPLASLPAATIIDFAPLLPMQLNGVESLAGINKILLGGAPVDPLLEKKLQKFSSAIFHGYGMTETLSHVALRRVNGSNRSERYEGLKGIYFETDNRDCLIIHSPFLPLPVNTNDVVELHSSTSFTWQGRVDFVVNSGGIKLFPEIIERKIADFMSRKFFLYGIPDERLGEQLCLFIEGKAMDEDQLDSLKENLHFHLEKYENPRRIFFIPQFYLTLTGKINRRSTVQGLKIKMK